MNRRGIALLVLIAVFLFGLLLGAGGVYTWGWRPWLERDGLNSRLTGRNGRPDQLAETLQLDPEQQVKLKAIYDDLRQELQSVRSDMGARFDSVRAKANQKIADILNEDQKKKFELILRRGRSLGQPYPHEEPREPRGSMHNK